MLSETIGILDWPRQLAQAKWPNSIVAYITPYLNPEYLTGPYVDWWNRSGAQQLFADCEAEDGYFVFFDDEEEAIGWVNEFPKCAAYCCLFVNGETVSEN